MALSPERRQTMRVFAETALRIEQTVPVGPKTLLDMLDEMERIRLVVIRTAEALDGLPDDSVIVADVGVLGAYHKRVGPDGRVRWWTTVEQRTVGTDEVPLPATLVFIPKRG